jgi:hypothetical protein
MAILCAGSSVALLRLRGDHYDRMLKLKLNEKVIEAWLPLSMSGDIWEYEKTYFVNGEEVGTGDTIRVRGGL